MVVEKWGIHARHSDAQVSISVKWDVLESKNIIPVSSG
jgi:hypothetical protein